MSGLPAQPVPVTIQDTTVIVGETKASNFLDRFSFEDKSRDSITNPKNDHFYYGQLLKSKRMISPMALWAPLTGKDTDCSKAASSPITEALRIASTNPQEITNLCSTK